MIKKSCRQFAFILSFIILVTSTSQITGSFLIDSTESVVNIFVPKVSDDDSDPGTDKPGTGGNEGTDNDKPGTGNGSDKDKDNISGPVTGSDILDAYYKDVNEKNVAREGLATAKFVGKKIKLSWMKIKGAEGYDIYFQHCGKKFTKKNIIKTVKNGKLSVKITGINGKKVTAMRNIKFKVRAFRMVNGKKVYISIGIPIHIAKYNSKSYTNVTKIKAVTKKIKVSVGKTKKIKVKVVKKNKKKKLLPKSHKPRLRYFSSNKEIATVTKKGKVKGVSKGKCYIYVIAQNGVRKRIKVTVK